MSANIIDGGRIGILSDTHGSLSAWNAALAVFGDVRTVLHAGDVVYRSLGFTAGRGDSGNLAEALRDYTGNILVSRGNCDSSSDEMLTNIIMPSCVSVLWNGKRIIMMHGDNFPLLRRMALDNKADLAIYGHTHISSVVREEGTIFLNPGSTTIPKGKHPASVAVADMNAISVITLDGGLLHREEW